MSEVIIEVLHYITCKILTITINEIMQRIIENVLGDPQNGFRKGRSTFHANNGESV